MEELGPILVIAYIILMLLTRSKKKEPPKPRPRQQVPRVPTVEPSREAAETERPSLVKPQQPAPPRAKRSLAEELLSMLQEQAEHKPEPVEPLPEVDDEAVSLEVIEPEVPDRHERFREMYVEEEPVERPHIVEEVLAPRPYAVEQSEGGDAYAVEEVVTPEPYAIDHPRIRRKNLSRSELRHAFIMREVLGPPKALE